MTKINRSYATLRISGDDLIPSNISNLLGYESELVQMKGQIFVGKVSGRERIAKSGMWRLKANACEPENLDSQVSEILDKLSTDINIWLSLSNKYKIDLFCGIFMEVSNEGMMLSPATLRLLGERNIILALDVYGPDDGGPKINELCPCESGTSYGECCVQRFNNA